jgi:hypothetical protein
MMKWYLGSKVFLFHEIKWANIMTIILKDTNHHWYFEKKAIVENRVPLRPSGTISTGSSQAIQARPDVVNVKMRIIRSFIDIPPYTVLYI